QLVGSLSRTDLLQVLSQEPKDTRPSRTDSELVQEMKARLHQENWVSNRALGIEARNGVLWLYGLVDNEEEKISIGLMARTIPGCTGVENGVVPRSLFRGHWM
ncbi:MAG TPA: BON domain-containing protein, partial [Candidatus Baltobacteraceae bacterium]|nr:BON domain-containing protein [Candidatus Baltobacteraceae bacterium]